VLRKERDDPLEIDIGGTRQSVVEEKGGEKAEKGKQLTEI